MKTLIAVKKSIDEMDRNAFKPRKMLTPVPGTVEYRTCGLQGFVPTATQIASGLCEMGAYVNAMTGSGSSIMDHLVKHNTNGEPVAKTATDVFAQAGIVMKSMKDTNFSGSDENNARSSRSGTRSYCLRVMAFLSSSSSL